jgi:SAM-dependent methyltransferase
MLFEFSRSGVVSSAVGVDVNPSAVSSNQDSDPRVSLVTIRKGQKLPFADASFDVVTLVGVLEHVHEQKLLLQELRRVLVDDGRLIVSVPGQHFFSFMDLGNMKFRFPRLHRWYWSRKHSVEEYQRRYVQGEDGLIGDIEVEKRWHEHFTPDRLSRLLTDSGYEILDADGFGYFMRPIHNAWTLSPVLKGPLYRLMLSDMRSFASAEIFVECRKA